MYRKKQLPLLHYFCSVVSMILHPFHDSVYLDYFPLLLLVSLQRDGLSCSSQNCGNLSNFSPPCYSALNLFQYHYIILEVKQHKTAHKIQ